LKTKPVVPREIANRDVDDAVAYYFSEGAEGAAMDFIGALEQAYSHISRHPATGSPRYEHEMNLPGLRAWLLTRLPPHCLLRRTNRPHRRLARAAWAARHPGLDAGSGRRFDVLI